MALEQLLEELALIHFVLNTEPSETAAATLVRLAHAIRVLIGEASQ